LVHLRLSLMLHLPTTVSDKLLESLLASSAPHRPYKNSKCKTIYRSSIQVHPLVPCCRQCASSSSKGTLLFLSQPSILQSNDENFLTLSFGAEDKPNNNNFNNFLSEIIHFITHSSITFATTVTNVVGSGPFLHCTHIPPCHPIVIHQSNYLLSFSCSITLRHLSAFLMARREM
jgi:hypothetical protein